MNRYRYLFNNIGVLSIANLGTRILSFLVVPLYTNILTTSEYGTYDLFNTSISLLVPILTMNLSEGLLRFSIEKENGLGELLASTFKYLVLGIAVLLALVGLNYKFDWIVFLKQYSVEFVLFYITTALLGVTTNYARGKDRIKEVAISGVIGAFTTICLNLLFLLVLKIGLEGYLLASIIGYLVQNIYLFTKSDMISAIKHYKINKDMEKKMLFYSVPLIVNSIAWWINSASDRYVVTFFEGVQSNGIYSMAYKIPSLLTMFNSIFNQAWILSSVKEFDKKDRNVFFSNTYIMYNVVMVMVCSLLIVADKGIALLIFKKDFCYASLYAPFLLISVVFGAVSGYMGGIFSTVQKTKITAYTVGIGAVINLVLNVVLVKNIGTLGAAISTVISYMVVWMIRFFETKKMIALNISLKKDLTCYSILILQAIICLLVENNIVLYFTEIVCFIIIASIYRTQLKKVVIKVLGSIRK